MKSWKKRVEAILGSQRIKRRFLISVMLLLGVSIAYFGSGADTQFSLSSPMAPRALPALHLTEPVSLASVEAPAFTQQPGEILQVKLVTLTSRGFDPEELTASKGRFVLDIENLTGRQEVFLSLENSRQELVQTRRFSKGSVNWARAFDLPSGTYVLREINHPSWRCTITVNP